MQGVNEKIIVSLNGSYTVEDAAKLLGISPVTLYASIYAGRMETGGKFGRQIIVSGKNLQNYINEHVRFSTLIYDFV